MYDSICGRTAMKTKIPVNNGTEHLKIVEDLRTRIASGKLKPGERLVEAHFSEDFGVTRSKIREALKKLEQNGFVTIIPNVGARVAEFSQKDIEHIYDLMSVLEGLAVRVITPFLTDQQLKRIEALVDKVEAVHKPTQFFERNNELHSFLIALTENDHLIKIADNFMFKIRCLNLQCLFSPGQMAAGVKEHRKILEAIKARNAVRAEQLMRTHLLSAKNRLIKFINKSL